MVGIESTLPRRRASVLPQATRTGRLATRLMGSSDLFHRASPASSLKFVASHDGFTLADLCSYTAKRNLANGEEPRRREQQSQHELRHRRRTRPTRKSTPNGFATRRTCSRRYCFHKAGPCSRPGMNSAVRNAATTTPIARTTKSVGSIGGSLKRTANCSNFVRGLMWFRRKHPIFRRSQFFSGKPRSNAFIPDVSWFDADGRMKRWDQDDQTLMCQLTVCLLQVHPTRGRRDIVPVQQRRRSAWISARSARKTPCCWRLIFDTGSSTFSGVHQEGQEPTFAPGGAYGMIPRSMALFRASIADSAAGLHRFRPVRYPGV